MFTSTNDRVYVCKKRLHPGLISDLSKCDAFNSVSFITWKGYINRLKIRCII